MDPQMLSEMRLLTETFAALRTGIRAGLNVNATVLQECRLLLELLVTDGTADVERHIGWPHANMLQDFG